MNEYQFQQQFNANNDLKKQKMDRIMDTWLDDQLNGKGNYNPFTRMIKEIHDDEPPYIPKIRTSN